MEIIGGGVFAILIFLVLAAQGGSSGSPKQQQCRACMQDVRWSKRDSNFVHVDGSFEAFNTKPCGICGEVHGEIVHGALPYTYMNTLS